MRLTKDIRKLMLNEILQHKFDKKSEKLKQRLMTFAQKEADKQYSGELVKWMKEGKKYTSKSCFFTRSNVHLKFYDGSKVESDLYCCVWQWNYRGIPLKNPMLVVAEDRHTNTLTPLTKTRSVQLKKIVDAMDALYAQYLETETIISQALGACSTDKQLKDNYPELAPFLPIESSSRQLMIASETVSQIMQAK